MTSPLRGAGGRRGSRLAALLLFLLGWIFAGVTGATPAFAHAELESSSPASGAALDSAPSELTLTFSESVTQVPGAMKLLKADGSAAALGTTTVAGNTLRVPIPGPLSDGGYVFVYRVVSADSHPVSGATTFALGETASAASADTITAALGDDDDPLVSTVGGVNRWVGFAGVILLVGVPAFVVLCRRSAATDPVLRALTVGGAVAVAGSALVSLPVQGARSFGGTLGDGFGEIDTVLDTTYGDAALARVGLVVLLVAALAAARRFRPALLLAGATTVALLVTFARTGHPAVGEHPWLTMAVDAVHFGAVAVWIGGLVVLAAHLLRQPAAEAAQALARWSPVAMAAVATLVATGSIQAWREVRSVGAFVDTPYGRWIVAKSVGLALLLALGEFGRRKVRALAVPAPVMSASLGAALAEPPLASGPDVRLLRRSVALELGIAAAVLAATSALVVTSPGGQHGGGHGMDGMADAAMGSMAAMPGMGGMAGHSTGRSESSATAGPVTASVELPNEVRVEVVADPARAGSAVLTFTIRSLSGDPVDPPEVNATAALDSAGISSITLTPVRAEAGRFTVDASQLLVPGVWTITVTVRTTDVDAGVGTVEIPLGPA